MTTIDMDLIHICEGTFVQLSDSCTNDYSCFDKLTARPDKG